MADKRVQLMLPCLVRDFLPEIGKACVSVLARAGVRAVVPDGQTCCGQPEYKRGHIDLTLPLARRMLDIFAGDDPVVVPSGSCAAMLLRYHELLEGEDAERARQLAGRTYEFSQYLVDVLGVDDLDAVFPARAVYHDSCQVGRTLGIVEQPRRLMAKVRGLTVLPLADQDRCCGLGGTFGLDFPEVSEVLVDDKCANILASGADVVITAEPSCLVNLRGWFDKNGHPIRVLHLAEVLAGQSALGGGR